MKISRLYTISAFTVLILASCSTSHPHGLPPGQAKKVTGSKSAKPFAPGQQKKDR